MKKNGKSLENLVAMIQKAISDRSNTQIFTNHKIEDSIGGKREIDVLIKSEINGIEILIAVECKDYSRPVSIDKIDAFKSKCDSIPGINKKVFVSKSGYASGAKRNADRYGISLYEVSELSVDSINNWFPRISQLRLKYQIVDIRYGLGTNDERILNNDTRIKPQLFQNGEVIHENIFNFIQNEVKANYQSFWNEAIMQFMRNSEMMLNEGIIQTCVITFPSGFSLLETSTDEHIPLVQFEIDVRTSLLESNPEILDINSYGELNKEDSLHQMSVDIGNKTKAEIVRTGPDKYEMFIKDASGELTQLSTLAIYDPEQDKLIDLLGE